MKRKTIFNVIIAVLIVVFFFSAYKIFTIMRGYHIDRNTYSSIRKSANEQGFSGDINWDKLREINSDVVGWIYLEGTNIDYPVVQGEDNNTYLSTKFDGEYGGCGTIFVGCGIEDPFKQFSTIVYGHHMKDGTMFAGLKEFINPDYCKEHSRFELITPDNKYHVDVVAFINPKGDSDIYTNNISEDERDSYIEMIKDSAQYTTDVEITSQDKIVLLSTCAYEFEGARYVVVGKLTPWE